MICLVIWGRDITLDTKGSPKVLNTEFKENVKVRKILVELDFPRNLTQEESIRRQNIEMKNWYNWYMIRGFPNF